MTHLSGQTTAVREAGRLSTTLFDPILQHYHGKPVFVQGLQFTKNRPKIK
jgi:hypothetical protein